jgi:hypothetical protein
MPEPKTQETKAPETTPEAIAEVQPSRPPLAIPTASKAKKTAVDKDKRSYRVIYAGSITHNAIEYFQGSSIDLTEEEAQKLLLRGVIRAE